ncbi:MAG TPA: sulfur carrier protein ThiS [Luteibaculaceae bacterium]|nr:sulfur carrier protein ThiS [Luteibaculaceae bacterium]
MELYFNSDLISLPESATLADLLLQYALIEKKGIAVAVNGKVISRTFWPDTYLQANDKIIVIRATQGG